MKFVKKALLSFAIFAQSVSVFAASLVASNIPLQTTQKMRNETRFLVYCMENGHYSNNDLSSLDMREFIRRYMENVDVFKMFFTTGEVQHFQDTFAQSSDIMLRQGTLFPAFSIYDNFVAIAQDRLKWIKGRMKRPFDLKQNSVFHFDRSKANWPASKKGADTLWDERLTSDIITEMLSYEDISKAKDEKSKKKSKLNAEKELEKEQKGSPKTFEEKFAKAKEEVLKRYERLIENWVKFDTIEIQELYLNALSEMYDPHSSFFSEYTLEDFDIAMRNMLVGIGATLQEKDGYCKIIELLPGSPAKESKQIETGDKILAVGQGDDGEMVDIVGMKLRNSVRMIRGKENTKVRLLIEPASNPSARKTVVLVRKEIKLTTKLAKANVYTVPMEDKTIPIGVIDLPSFYGETSEDGDTKGFSTSKNVEELLLKLKAYNIKGVILDLRRNGGGFLGEAVDLVGLFIKTGAVVQVRDSNNKVNIIKDKNPKVVWDGPLMVLVSRLSASATEIVAGALQDHRRAIIVGDGHTHGKGTVQTICPLSRFDPQQKSAAKFTIQKWYAPNGNSIQLKGVIPDVVLPSLFDHMDLGEQYKDNALVWDSIAPCTLDDIYFYGVGKDKVDALLKMINEQSKERQTSLDEFKFLKERIAWSKAQQDKKELSLNYKTRFDELKKAYDFFDSVEKREEEFSKKNYTKQEVLLDASEENKAKEEEEKKAKKDKKSIDDFDDFDEDEEEIFDIQLREALRIMADWISILKNA